tara:strand:+ start:981 stop:1814 length:834 start_codon:yes stop_codon:yes gene_type:complete
MKGLIVILFLIPTITFSSCLESIFIGKKFKPTISSEEVELLPNGKLSDGGSWWIEGNKDLHLDVEWSSTYIFPITSGLRGALNNRLKGYWVNDLERWKKNNLSELVPVNDEVKKLLIYIKENSSAFISFNICIDHYVEDKLSSWQKKGEFEKTPAFKKRVNQESINNMKVEYRKEAVDYYKKIAVSTVSKEDISLNEYDADSETFSIKISDYGSFNLPVPISMAPSFKENFKGSNLSSLDFDLVNGEFTVTYFEIDGFTYNIFGKTLRYDENGAVIR